MIKLINDKGKLVMKKFVLLLNIIVFVFAVAACTSNQPVSTTKTAVSQTQKSEVSSAVPSPAPSDSKAGSEASASPKASPSPSKSPKATQKSNIKTEAEKKAEFIEKTKTLKAGAKVSISGMDRTTLNACFFYEKIPDSVFARMKGKTFADNCTVKRSELRYVKVLHYGFDKKTHVGELVVNKALARDVVYIFRDLYKAKYPIQKIILEDNYDADDDASMADNNTSCFNFRYVEGTKTISKHGLGRAIDINPRYNPYIVYINGKKKIEPPNGKKYADRTIDLPYVIKKGDICYKTFAKYGFTWGGSWSVPDYQHFAKAK
jgi:hypothetical protein